MDFVKLNRRWVYGLTIEVFVRNFFTLLIIAAVNAALGVGQAVLGPFGLLLIPVYIYFAIVTLNIAHKSVVTGKAVLATEVFAITPRLKIYFWLYLGISLVPFVFTVAGIILVTINPNPRFGTMESILIVIGLAVGSYYLLLAFFGTSLTATAIGGDGMMMVTRGRLTFFYSLSRQIVLPLLLIGAILGAIWFYFDQMPIEDIERQMTALITALLTSQVYMLLLIVSMQMLSLFIMLITGVVLTKAFVLAELKIASNGEVSKWAAKAFGINVEPQPVRYV